MKTNWSSGVNLDLMARAVSEWYEVVAKGGKHILMTAFAKLRGIEPGTFKKYACADKTKRREFGAPSYCSSRRRCDALFLGGRQG